MTAPPESDANITAESLLGALTFGGFIFLATIIVAVACLIAQSIRERGTLTDKQLETDKRLRAIRRDFVK